MYDSMVDLSTTLEMTMGGIICIEKIVLFTFFNVLGYYDYLLYVLLCLLIVISTGAVAEWRNLSYLYVTINR